MGATKFCLNQIELNQPEEMILKLQDPARPLKDLGELKIVVTLTPKTQEDKEQVSGKKNVPALTFFSCAMDFFLSFLLNTEKHEEFERWKFFLCRFLEFSPSLLHFFRNLIFVIWLFSFFDFKARNKIWKVKNSYSYCCEPSSVDSTHCEL